MKIKSKKLATSALVFSLLFPIASTTMAVETAANPNTITNPNVAISQLADEYDNDDIEYNQQIQDVNKTSSSQAIAADKLILNEPVIDEAHILTPAEKQQLSQQLRQIYDKGLAQAAIVIVPTTNGMPIFDYAMQVAERWKLGKKDTDDGLLILVAINDRNIYILTGYGLEGVIPDAIAKRIIREDVTPYFKQGDYAAGLSAAVAHIEQRLSADPEALARADAQQQTSHEETPSLFGVFIIALVFGMFITNILGRIIGSLVTAGGFLFIASQMIGAGFLVSLIMAIFLWLFLLMRGSGGSFPTGGGGFGSGGFGGGGFGGSSGGFGGGFGGGGFSGGGGGFGGGGAGGSW